MIARPLATRHARVGAGVSVIPTRFPAVNLFDRVASPRDFEALYALEAMTNDRARTEIGELDLVPREERRFGPGYGPIMAAFTHLNPNGSRFFRWQLRRVLLRTRSGDGYRGNPLPLGAVSHRDQPAADAPANAPLHRAGPGRGSRRSQSLDGSAARHSFIVRLLGGTGARARGPARRVRRESCIRRCGMRVGSASLRFARPCSRIAITPRIWSTHGMAPRSSTCSRWPRWDRRRGVRFLAP